MVVKDRAAYNSYMRQYMRERCRKRRRRAEKMLGGKCVVCGTKSNLDIDHIDPSTKLLGPERLWTSAEEKFLAEIKKCQLLCRTCHNDKTQRENGLIKNKGIHGHPMNYARYGCKCSLCKAAWNAYNKKYRHKG
jgi:5-methylcytosine-specific restriction endonuclease McrA